MLNLYLKLISILLLALAVMPVLTSCKAEITNDKEDPTSTANITFKVHCSKMILIRLNDDKSRVEYTEELAEGQKSKPLSNGEFIGEFIYRLKEYADGSREIDCQISDGKRQFYNSASVSSRTAYMSDNLCSIVYDLDQPTNGSFSFYWHPNSRGLTYNDDYGLSKELFVRSSECSEL